MPSELTEVEKNSLENTLEKLMRICGIPVLTKKTIPHLFARQEMACPNTLTREGRHYLKRLANKLTGHKVTCEPMSDEMFRNSLEIPKISLEELEKEMED
jgi:hypothetical protein